MQLMEDIFAEYVAKRRAGLRQTDVLNVLRGYIEPLSKAQKRLLAEHVQNFEVKQGSRIDGLENPPNPLDVEQQELKAERGQKVHQQAPVEEPKSSERVTKRVQPLVEKTSSDTTKSQIKSLRETMEMAAASWVECANCHAKNRADAVFCYSCGYLLDQIPGMYGTKRFADAVSNAYDSAYFGPDSVLVLRVRDDNTDYDLRPQLSDHEIVIGRNTDQSVMSADVDLSIHRADQLGVSRLHLAVTWQRKENTLQVYDLGSANGSFLNGQKIHPKEIRVLRNGDQLRLGRLVLRTDFYHPGEEVD